MMTNRKVFKVYSPVYNMEKEKRDEDGMKIGYCNLCGVKAHVVDDKKFICYYCKNKIEEVENDL